MQCEVIHSDILGDRNKHYSLEAFHLIQPWLYVFFCLLWFLLVQQLFSFLTEGTALLPKNTHSYTLTSTFGFVRCGVISYTEAEGSSGGWKWGFQPSSHLCSPSAFVPSAPLVHSILPTKSKPASTQQIRYWASFVYMFRECSCLWCNFFYRF